MISLNYKKEKNNNYREKISESSKNWDSCVYYLANFTKILIKLAKIRGKILVDNKKKNCSKINGINSVSF